MQSSLSDKRMDKYETKIVSKYDIIGTIIHNTELM